MRKQFFCLLGVSLTLFAASVNAQPMRPDEKLEDLRRLLSPSLEETTLASQYGALKMTLSSMFLNGRESPEKCAAQIQSFIQFIIKQTAPTLSAVDRKKLTELSKNISKIYPKSAKSGLDAVFTTINESLKPAFSENPDGKPMIQSGKFSIIDKNGTPRIYDLDELNRKENGGEVKAGSRKHPETGYPIY